MPTFECGGCSSKIRVPDEYAGKRVRCPSCKEPQRVPAAAEDAMMDLSSLAAGADSGGLRQLRHILIGCGACKTTIKISESRMGKTETCSNCGVLLKVDKFDLSKAKGDLVDMSHLELETGDLLSDGTSHGSTLGGSAVQLEGTGAFSLNDASGGMSITDDASSQTQMRELKELNELKHSGAISDKEYKQRKSEIYAGKSLAIQAMSRSADGSSNKPVLASHESSLLPGPVKALIAVVVLGVGAFALYAAVIKPALQEPSSSQQTAAPTPQPQGPTPEEIAAEEAAKEAEAQVVAAAEAEAAAAAEAEAQAKAAAEAEAAAAAAALAEAQRTEPKKATESSLFDITIPDENGNMQQTVLLVESEMVVTDWPVEWPDVAPPSGSAIGKACGVTKLMTLDEDKAVIGVSVGPVALTLEDEEYVTYRKEMYDILKQTATDDGVIDDLRMIESDRVVKLGGIEAHRLQVTSTADRRFQAAIVTGVQDGYAVSYWFAGDRNVRLYSQFRDTVGKAELGKAE